MSDNHSNPMLVRLNTTGDARRTMFGFETDDHPRLDRFQNALSAVAGVIAGACVVVLVLLTCLEVFARTVLSQPLGWNVAFTESYLMVGAAFFGIVTAYRTAAHVAVTSIFEKLPFWSQKGMVVITHVLVTVVFTLLFWYGLLATLESVAMNEIPPRGSAELSIPDWIWKSFVPIASAMAFVIAVIDLGREIAAGPSVLATDYDPGDVIVEAE
ncbi:TRAP transporter small permease [Nocardia sp. NPDC058518]|uniref:TRAP transporter small permease n=1 Tax=Nocardia sp. NPDC058518 TaxID=3346534 RepID=UPI003649CB8D